MVKFGGRGGARRGGFRGGRGAIGGGFKRDRPQGDDFGGRRVVRGGGRGFGGNRGGRRSFDDGQQGGQRFERRGGRGRLGGRGGRGGRRGGNRGGAGEGRRGGDPADRKDKLDQQLNAYWEKGGFKDLGNIIFFHQSQIAQKDLDRQLEEYQKQSEAQ
ncbi:UNKNOWN [Stylonychia lemnae]|uniref:Chromatin target of PRMT1 protein C-terminal domain-containing protein n=1 Tax=Stylonychia lemnae TaxID=5949 RepID=A0A078AUP3_STYLE|nr:UNKNOWN [Stylonychia lemnae]|eukprot:CDW84603.1 UNKNOWN [Stylonychia lemnae]